MSGIRRFLSRLWHTIRPTQTDAETQREIAAHLSMLEDDFRRQGLSQPDARAAAHRALGGAEQARTLARDARLLPSIDDLRRDVGYGIRTLARSPGFTLVTVLTLAVGIGGTTSILSLAYSVLVRPLPFPETPRIVALREGADGNAVTYGNFGTWRERSREFEAFGAWLYGAATLSHADETARLSALKGTAGIWKVLALPPAAGRYFSDEEDRPGALPVVVLSYRLWRTRFAADPQIIGTAVLIDAVPRRIVGVAAEGYERMGIATDVWVPLALTPDLFAQHADHELTVYGLVRRGRPVEAARAELLRIEQQLKREYPKAGLDGVVLVSDLREAVIGDVPQLLLILGAATTLVLLLACSNIVNLLLARVEARQKEFAVRIALGASRGRIVTLLLVESLVLGTAAGTAGVLIAASVLGLASATWPTLASWQPTIDGPVLAATALIVLACSVLFGLLPALRVSTRHVQPVLRDAGHRPASVSSTTRNALVLLELVLAVMLVSGAGLLVRTAVALEQVPLGFEPHNRTTMRIALPNGRYRSSNLAAAFVTILTAAEHLPGVQAAALTSRLPLDRGANCGVVVEGRETAGGPITNFRTVTGNYFSTIGVVLRAGRNFVAQDTGNSPPVAIINDTLARTLFGDTDPLGRRVALCPQMSSRSPRWLEVVGVVTSMRSNGLRREMPAELFLPLGQGPADFTMTLVVQSREPLDQLAPAARKMVRDFDPFVPVFAVRSLDDVVAGDRALARWLMELFVALGAVGLLLAVIGVYGVVSYFVSQRAHEIGVRIAIGASRSQVISLVLRQGCGVALCGIAIGVIAAAGSARILDAVLFGVTSHDWLTFAVVTLVLLGAVLLAIAVPARRAARLDPIVTLRS